MRIFIDTNIICKLLSEPSIFSNLNLKTCEFFTFEKCIYELKNGLKTKFFDINFLIKTIRNGGFGDSLNQKSIMKVATKIVKNTLSILKLDKNETKKLVNAIGNYNLKWEFGIAEVYQWISIKEMEEDFLNRVPEKDRESTDVLRLKQFYKLVKYLLLKEYKNLEETLETNNVKIIYYEQVFGDPKKVVKFRMLLDDAILPTEDLEIIFSALSSNCRIFLTEDKKIHTYGYTLGLNHPMSFMTIDNFKGAIKNKLF